MTIAHWSGRGSGNRTITITSSYSALNRASKTKDLGNKLTAWQTITKSLERLNSIWLSHGLVGRLNVSQSVSQSIINLHKKIIALSKLQLPVASCIYLGGRSRSILIIVCDGTDKQITQIDLCLQSHKLFLGLASDWLMCCIW